MSKEFKEQCKLPESYKKAVEEVGRLNKKRQEEIERIMNSFKNKKLTQQDLTIIREAVESMFERGNATFELTEEERQAFTTNLTLSEQEKVYIQLIKEQAKGFFIIMELIKEQIELLQHNGMIDNVRVLLLARIKGLDSVVKNEARNKGKMEGKLKIVDDIFGATIIASSKKDVQTIRRQISNYLIKVTRAKTVNKQVKDKEGNIQPGYNAYHDMGYLNEEAYEWINDVDTAGYKQQIEQCIGEDTNNIITIEELEEIYKKEYNSPEELPVVEIRYQTEEEYERANGVASHSKYKQSEGQESVVDVQQKYLHEDFHRFVDIPLMFEWDTNSKQVRLLGREETLFIMYPYLKELKEKKETIGIFLKQLEAKQVMGKDEKTH